jgi:nucleotide-binding universal stress UspA family protein
METQARPERIFLVVVDDTDEMKLALSYACRRAAATGGRVALLRIVAAGDIKQWQAVEELIRDEARREAERALQRHAETVTATMGRMPILHVREGDPAEEVVKLIEEEPAISILVLGAAAGQEGPGPLVTRLAGKAVSRLRVPVTIVPGGLTEEGLERVS